MIYPTGLDTMLWNQLCKFEDWKTSYLDFDTILN